MTHQGGAAVGMVHCIESAVLLPLRGREGHVPPQLVKKVPSGFFAKLLSELQNEIL